MLDSFATEVEDGVSIEQFEELWRLGLQKNSPMLSLWKQKPNHTSLTPSDLQKWEKCILEEVTDPDEQRAEITDMRLAYARKYPTPGNFMALLDVYPSLPLQYLLHALQECGPDYLQGQLIWEKVLECDGLTDSPESVMDLFKQRLLTPHRDIRNTYEKYSQWVSSNNPENYTSFMREASRLVNLTEKLMRYIEKLETAIAENPDDAQAWITYMRKMAKFAELPPKENQPIITFKTVKQVFLRSLFQTRNRVSDPIWVPVWTAYIRAQEMHRNTHLRDYTDAVSDFMGTYPGEAEAFLPFLRSVADKDVLLGKLALIEKIMASQFSLVLAEEFLGAVRRLCTPEELMKFSMEYGIVASTLDLDPDQELLKAIIGTFEGLGSQEAVQAAQSLVIEHFESHAEKTDCWLLCFHFFTRHLPKHVKKLLTLWDEDALTIDDPEKLIHDILLYLRLNGSSEAYIDALNKADVLREKLLASKPQTAIHKESHEEEAKPKRTKTENKEVEPPARSREQFRIRLSPLAEGTTEDDIRVFFNGYGDPVTIQILSSTPREAIVELGSEQEVMTCLTRDIKQLKGEPVKISRLFANTVWVTNYPPAYSNEQVKSMINSFGATAVDIRFPLQSDLKQRRFCYADFSGSEIAQTVRNKLNGSVIENYTVQAEISNPTLKKERRAPPVTRQIYVHNLNFKETTEVSLRELFVKFGDIESVKLPLSGANQEKGNKNNGFAFVTFTTELAAQEAVKLGGAQLDGRRVEISKVKSKQNLSQVNLNHFKPDSTVSIHNINPQVSADQLQAFLESKVGPVAKLHLQPSKKAALVEFTTFKDAGKVGLLLEGSEYEDYILHVGLKDDFMKASSSVQKAPKMIPPMLMRRQRR